MDPLLEWTRIGIGRIDLPVAANLLKGGKINSPLQSGETDVTKGLVCRL